MKLPVFLTAILRISFYCFTADLKMNNYKKRPDVMACKRRQRSFQDISDRHAPNSIDQLTFKYMEMCKMDSSTDSDSEISPMWSDTSTLGCVSSAPESGTSPHAASLVYKSTGRHACQSLLLDPYDGSSEDSDASVGCRQTRQQGKGGACCHSCRRRRPVLHHPTLSLSKMAKNEMRDSLIDLSSTTKYTNDVQMKCGSDSELWDYETLSSLSDKNGCRNPTQDVTYSTVQRMDTELRLDDSGFHTKSSTPHTTRFQPLVEGSSFQMVSSCHERSSSSCNLRSLFKRKVGLPGADTVETGPRKRQCTLNMENEYKPSDY